MKRIYSVPLLFLFLLSLSSVSAQDDFLHKKDSLLNVIAQSEGQLKLDTYKEMTDWLFYQSNNIDTVLKYYDLYMKEALLQKSIMDEGGARASIISALLNSACYEDLIKRIDNDLAFFAKNEFWSTYYTNYRRLVKAYSYLGQKEKALEETNKMYDQAKKNNHPVGVSNALLQMGEFYQRTGRVEDVEKAIEYYRECLETERKSDKVTRMRLNAYFFLTNSIVALNRFDEALSLLKENEADLKKCEEQTGRKEPSYRLDMYRIYLQLYANKEEWDKIEHYCQLVEESANTVGIRNSNANYRARALMAQKEYKKAFEQIEISYAAALELGDQHSIVTALRHKAYLLSYLGKPDEAKQTINSLLSEKDSINSLEIHTRLDELRIQYDVDKHKAEKQRNRNYFLFALGGCILLAVSLGIGVYYSRQILHKNRELVRKAQQWANVAPAPVIADEETEPETQLPKTVEPDETERLLFAEIEQLIDRGLYKESSLSLDMLAGKTNQNPTYISKAVSRCTGKTFKTWLNEYRIKEAVRLLSDKNNPNISIETVAFDSGFNDRITFYRIFKKVTGITPTDFKKNGLHK